MAQVFSGVGVCARPHAAVASDLARDLYHRSGRRTPDSGSLQRHLHRRHRRRGAELARQGVHGGGHHRFGNEIFRYAEIYTDVLDACKKIITIRDTFTPNVDDYRTYLKYFDVYKKLYKQNKILFEMEKEIRIK